MKKVIVIGCPGAGKSEFSRKLEKLTGFPLYHLDLLYWNADRTSVPKEVFRERQQKVFSEERWILDGNYASTMEMRLQACDTVFFLDYQKEVCLEGVHERIGKKRPDLPWMELEEDEEFLDFVRNYRRERRPVVLELLEKYRKKEIHIFQTREEAEEFLNGLNSSKAKQQGTIGASHGENV